MQNSYMKSHMKSPQFDFYNNYSNISPLISNIPLEKKQTDSWSGNFFNNNLISNQSCRIKVNLELSDIMTPNYRGNQIPEPSNQNFKSSFGFIRKEDNNNKDRRDDIKKLPPTINQKSSSFLINYDQVLNKKRLKSTNINLDEFPKVQSSILKYSDNRSSSFGPYLSSRNQNNLTNKLTENLNNNLNINNNAQPLNLTIINTSNYFVSKDSNSIDDDKFLTVNKKVNKVKKKSTIKKSNRFSDCTKKSLINYDNIYQNKIKYLIDINKDNTNTTVKRKRNRRKKTNKNNNSNCKSNSKSKIHSNSKKYVDSNENNVDENSIYNLDNSKCLSSIIKNSMKKNNDLNKKEISSFNNYPTQTLEINDITRSILHNEITKFDSHADHLSNEEISDRTMNLYIKKVDSTHCKVPRVHVARNKGVRVELVEKNNFEECDLNYLLEPFTESNELNSTCNYFNRELKNEFLQNKIHGVSNERSLNFGMNPLTIYKDLSINFLRIKSKIETSSGFNLKQANEEIYHVSDKMNEINSALNSQPILKIPADSKYNPIQLRKGRRNGKINFTSINEDSKFECKICNAIFNTGQGLGGHVSRIHQGQSENYNRKKETRMRRQKERNLLYESKKIILAKCGYDIDTLLTRTNKDGKATIRRIIDQNRKDFVKLKRELKKKVDSKNKS